MVDKLKCSECPYIAPRIERLRCHIRVQHQGLRLACKLCHYTATESSNLNRHIASVHDNVKYECDYCQKVYKEKNKLKHHIDYQHEKKERKKYSCADCDKTWTSKSSFSSHIKVHQGVLFSCDKCLEVPFFLVPKWALLAKLQPMSLSGDKGVAQFKKSVKMGHPNHRSDGRVQHAGHKYRNTEIRKFTKTQTQIHKLKYTGQTEEFNTRGTKGKRSLDRLYVVVVTADRRQQTSETLGCCKMKSKSIK